MKRALLMVFGFATLLAAAIFLYRKTEAVNLDVQSEIVHALRDLKRLDAEWNANVLKARVGIAANYDAVASTQLEIRALRDRLVHSARPIHDDVPDTAMKNMNAVFADKEDAVEQFKSENAILRNSLRYLPTSADEIKEALGAEPRSLQTLDDAVDRLVSYVLRYNIGNLALKAVADRLQHHIRKDDAFARLGGDEFVILLGEAGSRDGAIRLAEDVLQELHALVEIDGHPVRLSASIGISSARGGGESPESLLSLADHAMYEAKQEGKGCYRFSSSDAWSQLQAL
jgi:diguanylate cyclase (GGDEF)-like protein